MAAIELLLLSVAVVLLLSIAASKFAVKSGIPALLLFLALGMLAGSEGIGGIYFDNAWIAQLIGVIALVLILFAGGLDTEWADIRPVLRQGVVLATIGVITTALTVGAFASALLRVSFAEGVLLGAIISSTDAAAVFALLRGKGVHLKGRIKPLLELESGSNDPMAVFLTLGMIQLVANPQMSPAELIPMFILQMGVGALTGLIGARLMIRVLNRARLEYDGLYPVLTVAGVLLIYGAATMLRGNGFLAVYLAAVSMKRYDFIHKRSLIQFHDGLAWLMQITMFLTLGLLVFPSQLPAVAGDALLIALFLIFLARPLSVLLALIGAQLSLRAKLFIAWVGLRGAAPIILATFPLLAGLEKANTIFNLVFFIVITSVLFQGMLLVPVAKLLRVYDPNPATNPSLLAYVMRDDRISNNLFEFVVPQGAPSAGKQILDLGLPDGTLIVLMGRAGDLVVPRGSTVIEPGDKLLVLTQEEQRDAVRAQLGLALSQT